MEILKVKENIGGLRYIVRLTNNYIISFYSNSTLTVEQLEEREAAYIIAHEYDHVKHKEIDILENEELIREFMGLVLEFPNPLVGTYNSWLNTKTWDVEVIINYFILGLVQKIAEDLGDDISEYSQNSILLYLRDWLIGKDIIEIEKVIYG